MKPIEYEFRIKTTYKDWNETDSFSAGFFTDRATAAFLAKATANLWGYEVRMNEKGSENGSYFHVGTPGTSVNRQHDVE